MRAIRSRTRTLAVDLSGKLTLKMPVSPQTLLVLRPEVVIMSSGAGTQAEQAGRWRRLALLPAVQQGALYELDPDLLHRQGPRLIEAARTMCERLERARAAPGERG